MIILNFYDQCRNNSRTKSVIIKFYICEPLYNIYCGNISFLILSLRSYSANPKILDSSFLLFLIQQRNS